MRREESEVQYPALLVVTTGALVSLGTASTDRFLMGRSNEANLQIPDPQCSRSQAEIHARGGGHELQPLSLNVPTLLNGKAIQAAERLSHSDEILLGGTRLVYLTQPLAPVAPADPTQALARNTVFAASLPEAATAAWEGEATLGTRCRIGRDPGLELCLPHVTVSRRHAEITLKAEGYVLRDLGSSNGTFVNGERILRPRVLQLRDRIDIGPHSLSFTGDRLLPSSRAGNLRLIGRELVREVQSADSQQWIRILDDVSLVIEPNEFVCLLGPSGSGKTTLMNALSARVPATRGRVSLNDVNLYANFEVLKQDIAMVPQQDVLHEDLLLEAALTYTARLRLPPDTSAAEIDSAVASALEAVNLSHRRSTPIGKLSGGQKKRASLANEIVCCPSVLFVDEVTSGLDEATDWEMMKLFREMAERGMTVACVTHTVANVEEFCHRVVVMANPGTLAFFGTPQEALEYFKVRKLGDVYRSLGDRPGSQWQQEFRAHPLYRRDVEQRLLRAGPERDDQLADPNTARTAQGLASEVMRQFRILAQRLGALMLADRQTLAIAVFQSILVGLLLYLVFEKIPARSPNEYSLVFFLGMSCIWYGCNNASKEIVKERPIYLRERDVNLSVLSYLFSKVLMLSVLGIAQAGILFGLVEGLSGIPGNPRLQLLQMIAAVLTGTCMGLLISAACRTRDQASTAVPIALIPQIVLGGLVVSDLPAIPDFIAHGFVSGFWSYQGLEAVIQEDYTRVALATGVLAAHSALYLLATGLVLAVRDVRGEVRYGELLRQWVKRTRSAR